MTVSVGAHEAMAAMTVAVVAVVPVGMVGGMVTAEAEVARAGLAVAEVAMTSKSLDIPTYRHQYSRPLGASGTAQRVCPFACCSHRWD